MAKSRSDIHSEHDRLEGESVEIREHLELRTGDLESVSEVFDNIIADAGTEEGMAEILDNLTNAQTTGADKHSETSDQLDEKTTEVDENKDEVKENADQVNENIEAINEAEGNIEDSELQGEVQNAEQSAVEDFDFLEDAQEQLMEIAEQSRQIADVLKDRAETAKAKGV